MDLDNSYHRKRKAMTLDEIEAEAEDIRTSDMSPAEKHRQMILIYSRRKRAKKQLKLEELLQQKKDMELQVGALRSENRRLQSLLGACVVESLSQHQLNDVTKTKSGAIPPLATEAPVSAGHPMQTLQDLVFDGFRHAQGGSAVAQAMSLKELLYSARETSSKAEGLPSCRAIGSLNALAELARWTPNPSRGVDVSGDPVTRPTPFPSPDLTVTAAMMQQQQQFLHSHERPVLPPHLLPRKAVGAALANALSLEAVLQAQHHQSAAFRSWNEAHEGLAAMGEACNERTVLPPRALSDFLKELQETRSYRSWS